MWRWRSNWTRKGLWQVAQKNWKQLWWQSRNGSPYNNDYINNSGKHAFIFVVFFDCFFRNVHKKFYANFPVPIFFFGWKPSNNWIFSNRLKTWGWLGSRDASKAKRAWSDFTDDCFVSVSFNRINLTLIRLPSWAYWVTSKRCKMPSRKGCFSIVFIVNMWLTWRKPSVSTFCVL